MKRINIQRVLLQSSLYKDPTFKLLMKQSILLSTIAAGIALLSLSGSSAGPAASGTGDNTGRRSPALTCAASGCHGAVTSDIQLTATFMDKATGQPLTGGYIPGKAYEVLIDAVNNVNANNRFGFQAVLVTGSNTQAGNISASALPADYRLSNSGGIGIVEHRRVLTAAAPGNEYQVAFDWTAPQSGTGPVTLWAIFNAVNGNGSADAGDRCNMPFSTTITENTGTSVADAARRGMPLKVYPNPVTDLLHVEMQAAVPGDYNVTVHDLSGVSVYQTRWSSYQDRGVLRIETNDWAPGIYLLQLMTDGDGGQQIIPFIRQ